MRVIPAAGDLSGKESLEYVKTEVASKLDQRLLLHDSSIC